MPGLPNLVKAKRKRTERESPGKSRSPGDAIPYPLGDDTAAREAVETASLLSPSFPVRLLVHLGITPEVLDRCFEADVFSECEPGEARFTRPDVQRKTAESLPWPRRRRLHARLAEALEATGGRAETIAEHYRAAHAYARARKVWIEAAEAACARNDYPEALDAFRNALDIWPSERGDPERRRVLHEAARCAENGDNSEVAEEAWNALFHDALGRKDTNDALEACHRLANLARRRGDAAAIRRRLNVAAELADRSGDFRTIAKNRFTLAAFLADRIRLHAALNEIEAAENAAVRCDDPGLESEVRGFRGLILAMLGRATEAREAVDASLRLALDHNQAEAVATAYRRLANLREYAADYPGERDAQIRAIEFCREKGVSEGVHTCLSCLSYAFYRTGQWKRALKTANEVLGTEDAHPALRATAQLVRGLIGAFRGERRKAELYLDEALLNLRRENLVGLEFFALWAQALLAESDARPDDAAALYTEVRLLWTDTEDLHDVVPALLSATAFYADRKDLNCVRECVDILNRIAAHNDTVEVRGARQAARGEAARAEGDFSVAVQAMRHSVSEYHQLGTPVEEALVRHRLALALAANGENEEALRCEKESAAIAERLGMRLILEKLERERPGGCAHGERTGSTAGLTERQREVLALMAGGLTNKEIADRLCLSPRTVEMHVARTLERLHCRTRAQATRKASDLGVV